MTIPSSRSLILWIGVFSITSPSADFGRLRKTSDFFGNDRVVFKNPSTPRKKKPRLHLRKSWQVYISKFMKRMNFVTACLRPSQNVKLGIFKGSRAVDSKEMYKKAWCTGKVVVSLCQAIAYLTFSSPPHLKLPNIYDTLWSVKNRIFLGQIGLLLLIAP